ncbi:MAG: DUF6515 family protein [Candidatus Omnitrophica bacterium]|nr:DUF6515 family protein [Candidatus Omnitrophota bacterium]
MLKRYIVTILIAAFLMQPFSAFAGPPGGGHGSRGDFHGDPHGRGDFHGDYVAHRLPAGYISLIVAGLTYLYCEGLFYRYSQAGYVVVPPPVGAVVPALPPGYTMVIVNGAPYYVYGYTYYAPAPAGYMVVTAPATAVPVAVPTATPAAPPVSSQAASSGATSAATKAEDKSDTTAFEIYIANDNGSYTLVTLRKTDKGFVGPQGELYPNHPTVEELKARYTKK